MICKQLCPRDYMKTGVPKPLTLNSSSVNKFPAFSCSGVGITLHGGPVTSLFSQTLGRFNDI